MGDALKLVENMTDEEIENLNRGGRRPFKVLMLTKQLMIVLINPQLF